MFMYARGHFYCSNCAMSMGQRDIDCCSKRNEQLFAIERRSNARNVASGSRSSSSATAGTARNTTQ